MQVLLIKDVDNLGYAGDVKKVANGYGRNYLLPQGLAVLATPGALKQAETIRKTAEKHRAREMEDAQAISNQLAGIELLFERRAGETGKLYGSVTSGDIATAIQEKTGIELDKRKVALPEPIRNLGKQEVIIKLMIDLSTTINVEVLPLGGILERERLTEAEAAELEAEAEADADMAEETMTPQVSEIAEEVVEVEVEVETEPEDTTEADADSEDVEPEAEENKDTE
jgi:large subunit ribosomal protein L9